MKIICAAIVLLIQTSQCLASDDSPFQLTNTATGYCLVKTNNQCHDIRWTTGDRLLVQQKKKCLGVQGKSVGSEMSLYDCDENSELQKWECKNETVLALKDQELYIELTADNTAVLSRTIGPNNHLTISGTSSGACTRTYREYYSIAGNAAGMPCMFPFLYRDQWHTECIDSSEKQNWCAVETKNQSERWGYCPSPYTFTEEQGWRRHPTTGAYYQLNTQSALTWPQAATSCKQQGASLLSITDPHEHAYVITLLGSGGNKVWIGLISDPEHGWKWSNGRPYRYMKWDSGHPLPYPGHNCAIGDPAVQYSWQSSPCSKKFGYICSSQTAEELPTQAAETGFCSRPWIPYNGHCFHLNRTQKTWNDAQRACRDTGGDLVSIRNLEDQSFLISQLGYASTDELWIGLNDIRTEGLFDWIDHSTVSFTSWEFGKPVVSSQTKDCVVISGENGNWADRVCTEKHGFICMKMSASQPIGDEVQQDVGCRAGWRRHGSYCYFIGTQSKTFDEAKDDCKSSNSYLADVSHGVDNAFLVSLVGLRPEKHFWIGLSNQRNIAEFVWTKGNSVRFTHWNAEMPGHQQGCVAMKTGIFAGLWDVLPCTNTEKYICKHLAEGASLTPAPPTPVAVSCAAGWTRIGTRNYCFKLFMQSYSYKKTTWYEARRFCRAIGGDLLSIHSAAELTMLPYRSDNVWIGLSAPDPVTGYVWSDGSPLQFQHWEDGEPNNRNNVESCVELKLHQLSDSGSWNDVHCEMSLGWVCQIRTGVNPSPPPVPATPDYNTTSDGWLEWKGNQYYVNKVSRAMEEARHFCQKRHSDLVTINSEAERVFLWKQTVKSYASYWIGLTVDLDKTYGWMDGSPVVFQSWDENQPQFQRNDENCAAMTRPMGFWHNYNCGNQHYTICKRGGTPPANATVAPTVPPRGGCPQNWKKMDSKCYNIINSQRETWEGARTQCKAMGGNLASIISRDMQVFLTSTMAAAPSTDLWIGLRSERGSFFWTDGRPFRYSSWGNDAPDSYPFDRMHDPYYGMDYYGSYMHDQRECAVMSTDPTVGIGKWAKKPCSDTNGYVCLRNVDPSLPEAPEPTAYTDYVKICNDSIKVITQPMTWDAAKKHCEGEDAKLASLRNEWSQVYIELMALTVKAPLWIGLNRKETGGYFRYTDGWRLTINNWGRQEPSSNRPCVYVDVDGQWKTADCNENKTSICMKSTDVPPTESSEFPGFCPDDPDIPRSRGQPSSWLPFKGHCYLFITENTEWPHASVNCERHGGTLASIEDPSEQEFIHSNIKAFKDSHFSFWIGLYKTHRGMWQWLDKTVMDFNNWGEGQPGDSTYGTLRASNGMWHTENRWYNRPYICKTKKVLPEIPPTAVTTVLLQTRGHKILAVVLVITLIAIGTISVFIVFKKFGRHLPIPEKLTTFDNPLFFNNERHRSDLVDTQKLVANAEEENPGPIITV